MPNLSNNRSLISSYNRAFAILAPLFKWLEAILELLIPYWMINLINLVAKQQVKNEYSLIYQLVTNPYLLLIILAALLSAVFSISAQYMASKFATDYSASLKEQTYLHCLSLDNLLQTKLGQAYLNTRVITDCLMVQTGLNLALRLLLRSPFVVIGAIIMAFFISSLAGWILLLANLVIALIIYSLLKHSLKVYAKVQEQTQLLFTEINEAKTGQACIRAFNAQTAIIDRFIGDNQTLTSLQRNFSKLNSYIGPFSQTIINLALLICLFLLLKQQQHLLVGAAALIAIYSYFNKSLIELIKLADLIINISKALGSFSRIKSFLALKAMDTHLMDANLSTLISKNQNPQATDFKKEQFPNFNAKLLDTDRIDLIIENLDFSYQESNVILKNLDLGTLHFQKRYGILGLTASGKSTLAKLLAGLYAAPQLKIALNGQTLHFDDQASQMAFLRRHIAFVEQEPHLFSGTLADNFIFNNQNPSHILDNHSQTKIHKALELAAANDFIEAKGGINCQILEGASNFSGGQRARLALAIALYQEPKILILDDFLQALDLQTSLKLMKTIKELPFPCTVICLSQRVATLFDCDQIFVLDQQHLIAKGTHAYLMENCSLYRELFDTQYPAELLTNS